MRIWMLAAAVLAGRSYAAAPKVNLTKTSINTPALNLTVLPQSLITLGPTAMQLTAPTAVLNAMTPSALVTPAAPQAEPPARLIDTLAAPQPDFSKMGEGQSSLEAGKDFEARAQLGFQNTAVETGAALAKDAGASAVLKAYEDGSLAHRSPALNAELEKTAQTELKRKLAEAKFKVRFLYGGFFGTFLYESEDLPGVVLKVYSRSIWDGFMAKGRAWRGYGMAKKALAGLFADTSIVEDVEVTIEGKKKRFPWVLVQETINTKGIKEYGRRANETHDNMKKRGVQDTDLGVRGQGTYDAETARNLGESADGLLKHFDADFFKKHPQTEAGRRVPEPAVLVPFVREAQRQRLAELGVTEGDGSPLAGPVDAFVSKLNTSPEVERHLNAILAVAKRSRLDDRPAAQYLVKRLAGLKEGGTKDLSFNKGFFLSGMAAQEKGALTVSIFVINHEPKSFLKDSSVSVGKEHNPKGANLTYAQVVYGVLKAAALKAASDPSIKTVRIEGKKVMNEGLKSTFAALGFTYKRDPRVPEELAGKFPGTWVLEVPVR